MAMAVVGVHYKGYCYFPTVGIPPGLSTAWYSWDHGLTCRF